MASGSSKVTGKDKYKLILYPVEDEFLGKIDIKYTKKATTGGFSTIVILDRSGSMRKNVGRLTNIVLPQVFQNLNYSPDEDIYLITFDSQTEIFKTSINGLLKLDIKCRGCTYMRPAVKVLGNVITKDLPEDHSAIRLLTISDGAIHDPNETQAEATNLTTLLQNKYEINSQAVRLFTSETQPDTRAISSLLQLNTVTQVNLLDVSTRQTDEELSSEISGLFKNDHLTCQTFLHSSEKIMKKTPWAEELTDRVTLFPGENVFFLSKMPTNPLIIEDLEVEVRLKPELSMEMYEQLMEKKLKHYKTQLKIYKVVDTPEANTKVNKIVTQMNFRRRYLINREQDIQQILNNRGLRDRLHYLQVFSKRSQNTAFRHISHLAYDKNISVLNFAQQAEYLRTDHSSNNTRIKTRHFSKQGTGVNDIARREVLAMMEHLTELDEVDDTDHAVSFYSHETTLSGIRTLCDVPKDLLYDLDLNDLLMLLNIVGVSCSAPIGCFPDPSTWKVEEIYVGCYLSVSDILTVSVQTPGAGLKIPGTEKDITNIIPVFDDKRIAMFLRKYAPYLLEYASSIGMRKYIKYHPKTCGYTVCAAIWKMIEYLNTNKSVLHLKTFEKFVENLEFFDENYFQHILPIIRNQKPDHKSYYIAKNGVNNMISLLTTLYRLNDESDLVLVPNMLRALYSYEVWQAIRRHYETKDDNYEDTAQKMLVKLLGIDLEYFKTHLTPSFVSESKLENITFYDGLNLNEPYLSELEQKIHHVAYVGLIAKYIQAVVSGNIKTIVNVPSIDESMICEALNIDYDLKTFNLYNIVQSLAFATETSRVDHDNQSMKIIDLKYKQDADTILKDYLREQLERQFGTEVLDKKNNMN